VYVVDSQYPPRVGKLTVAQIAQQSTWSGVADRDRTMAAMHVIHVVPSNGSTETSMNPLDPGTAPDADGHSRRAWLYRPGTVDRVVPAGRL
jgi:hypothetical protein